MNSEETITIKLSDYLDMREDSDFMRALESAGVDNWEGYDFAREIYQEMNLEKPIYE